MNVYLTLLIPIFILFVLASIYWCIHYYSFKGYKYKSFEYNDDIIAIFSIIIVKAISIVSIIIGAGLGVYFLLTKFSVPQISLVLSALVFTVGIILLIRKCLYTKSFQRLKLLVSRLETKYDEPQEKVNEKMAQIMNERNQYIKWMKEDEDAILAQDNKIPAPHLTIEQLKEFEEYKKNLIKQRLSRINSHKKHIIMLDKELSKELSFNKE